MQAEKEKIEKAPQRGKEGIEKVEQYLLGVAQSHPFFPNTPMCYVTSLFFTGQPKKKIICNFFQFFDYIVVNAHVNTNSEIR